MPIWIPIIVGGLVGAAIGGTVDAIIEALKCKRLAVLGERKVGKTTLIKFLTTGTLSTEYVPGRSPQKTPSGHIKLKDLELKIEESVDVPGHIDFYRQWKDIVKEADIVLYLLRVDKLMEGDKQTEERVKRDIGHIGNWLKEDTKKFPLYIIGTYCDLSDPDLTKLPEDKLGDYDDYIRTRPIFQYIALRGRGGNQEQVVFVFGSLKSKDTTEKLVYNMLASLDASKS